MFVLLLAISSLVPSWAAPVKVKICVQHRIWYEDDVAGDFWNTNTDYVRLRGVKIRIEDLTAQQPMLEVFTDDGTGSTGNGGCYFATLDDSSEYRFTAISVARVRGVDLLSHGGDWPDGGPDDVPTEVVLDASYVPTVAETISYAVGGSQHGGSFWSHLAVATWALYRNDMGVPSGTVFKLYHEVLGAGSYYAAENAVLVPGKRRFVVAHELGHGVADVKGDSLRSACGLSPQDGCAADLAPDGSLIADSGHGIAGKEYQSCAAQEGWADFYSAWVFNRRTETDCVLVRPGPTDFDLADPEMEADNEGAPVTGDFKYWVNCDGAPNPAWDDPGDDAFVAAYVSDMDWLGDLVNAADARGCTANDLTNRGAPIDWTRFWWDMTARALVAPETLAQVHVDMDSATWSNKDGNLAERPSVRLARACGKHNITAECDAWDENGVNR